MSHVRIGFDYEDKAADYLLTQGMTLLARRYKRPGGELDLVALDGEEVVVVEVKQGSVILPEANVTTEKVRRIIAITHEFLSEFGLQGKQVRFDVIAFDKSGLRHHKAAFSAD